LSFKPDTDDIREAPSVYILEDLLQQGYEITVYDPAATKNIKRIFGNKITYVDDPYQAVNQVAALLILTEWNEFKQIDLKKVKKLMAKPLIIDGRNLYPVETLSQMGFTYISTGRKIVS
jgi:UDPglucose 6-dehydrogenase